ncbi:hypothetical protein BTO04_13680 [Polaribacter sp. SA4-10]|uniref:hypothetical protein n=1 Tax=Polaribacter sp. SA4-10 TaxID=754397 RepID=UPI000B3C152E|nr:hypothetical protein [Polaribacter sp. SA4-10]ARV07677.1 hypothetical protein BTO04_13680 [Polaribacter sp. SA4-10]
MTKKLKQFTFLFILVAFSNGFLAQEITMKISSKKEIEKVILEKLDFKKKHNDITAVKLETEKISNYLKKIGYFTNTIDSISISDKLYVAYFSLNKKIDKADIKLNANVGLLLKKLNIEGASIIIPIEEVEPLLNKISKELENQGKSFSIASLKNIELRNKTLFADLEIYQSEKRKINEVIIKGYENFPNAFIKYHFKIKKETVFNQKKIKEISSASKNLTFTKEIKQPEVLFTKDSTLLFIYLKKYQNNTFDGMVNFSSKENGGIKLNGHLDLKLNNILNTGEKFELFWNSTNNQSQEFKIATEIPYLFNTSLTPKVSFAIFRQDSTFIKTKFSTKIFYDISPKIKIATTFSSESSENLEKKITNNIASFNNYFFGFQFEYSIPKNDSFFNDKLLLRINPSVGKRTKEVTSSNQFKIETTASYIWDFNLRSSLFIRNKTGYLNSDSFIDNELYRIGGANSIRGLDDLSIITSSYSFFNIELRYLTSNKSYLYTITDIGRIKTSSEDKNLFGIGLGYLFNIKNSQITLSAASTRTSSETFNLKNSKLIISWKTFF